MTRRFLPARRDRYPGLAGRPTTMDVKPEAIDARVVKTTVEVRWTDIETLNTISMTIDDSGGAAAYLVAALRDSPRAMHVRYIGGPRE